MFDSSTSTGYRRLGRNGGGVSRNFTFFGILLILVVIFSTFYLYISASNDVTALKYELRNQADYTTKLKNELLEVHVILEELKTSESGCKESKITLDRQLEECAAKLKQANEDAQMAKSKNTKISDDLEALKSKNTELSTALNDQKLNMTAMQTVGVGQEAILIKFNETIDALRRDLILKDELIRKLEGAKSAVPAISNLSPLINGQEVAVKSVDDNKEVAPVPPAINLQLGTTTKSNSHVDEANVLAVPNQAQPGDRVKIEEANQKKENDGALLQAAAQQDVDAVGIEAPLPNMKSGET